MGTLSASLSSAIHKSADMQGSIPGMFMDAEKLSSEATEAAAARTETLCKLRSMEAKLENSKELASGLQADLDDACEEAARAKQKKELLLSELETHRDKVHSLSRRHEQLAKKAQALDERLLRSPCPSSSAEKPREAPRASSQVRCLTGRRAENVQAPSGRFLRTGAKESATLTEAMARSLQGAFEDAAAELRMTPCASPAACSLEYYLPTTSASCDAPYADAAGGPSTVPL